MPITDATLHSLIQKDFGLIYGRSSSGKSTWLTQVIEFLYTQTGKKSRIYCGDGGAATYHAMGLVEDGLAEVWDYTAHAADPMYVCKKVADGAWPVDADDPNTALVVPADTAAFAGYFFEGLTVMGDYLLSGLSDRSAKGERTGAEDAPFVMNIAHLGDSFKVGGSSRSSFGTAQGRIRDTVLRSKRLQSAGSVVMWTAHERMVEDKDENETIVGPACAGKALTPILGGWFGNMVHMTTATKKGKQKDQLTGKDVDAYIVERRAYTREHGDPDGAVFKRYIANTRVSLKVPTDPKLGLINPLPEYIHPPDPITYYRLIAEASAARTTARKAS